MTINEVIFDLETQKLFADIAGHNPGDLRVSIVSCYQRTLNQNLKEKSGQMFSFWEENLNKLWPILSWADRIVGFNSSKFDVPVLQAYTKIPLSSLPHFDILEKIRLALGKRISLNDLAQINLKQKKIDVGLNAVKYYYQGDPESLKKLKEYCENDVLVTKNIYDLTLREGYLKIPDQRKRTFSRLKLDFSYPKSFFAISQEKLF
ncbi:MAG: ribonuclease H-like domain-containing protein [Candidatus Shapirobacteria bacterium]|nr:ribonuclease H-like domain-containing protein [Candidatus Shapirobacteria bacterium]MDD5073867.1 ribonuclease H-like domain-containing protein [Candidatus Shapirobacteria bacterium]MDD5481744.1 ribonuclease H-like domain-containing protein [Candidatus Shapirobacteria bacterium]